MPHWFYVSFNDWFQSGSFVHAIGNSRDLIQKKNVSTRRHKASIAMPLILGPVTCIAKGTRPKSKLTVAKIIEIGDL